MPQALLVSGVCGITRNMLMKANAWRTLHMNNTSEQACLKEIECYRNKIKSRRERKLAVFFYELSYLCCISFKLFSVPPHKILNKSLSLLHYWSSSSH